MATTFYGTVSNYWCAYGSYTTTTTNTGVTISLTGGWHTAAWRFNIDYVDCTAYIGSTSNAITNGSVNETSGTVTEDVALVTASDTITRTTSAQTVTLKVVTYNHSGYKDGTSTATTTVTIPALASYTVTYNANGGSGAPSSQTKYYGKTLTLSTTVPTRSGYSFLGWSTSSSATSATYAAGGSYTANASATLYAVWELDGATAPTISSFTAYRATSSGSMSSTGSYLRYSVKWSVDTAYNSSNTGKKLVVAVTPSGGTTTSYTAFSSSTSTGTTTSGTLTASLDSSTVYTVKATLTDVNGLSASKTVKLSAGGTVLAVGNAMTNVALLGSATAGVAVAVGYNVVSSGTRAVSVGQNIANDGPRSVAMGDGVGVLGNNQVAIGYSASVGANANCSSSVAIGSNTVSNAAAGSVALGVGASATAGYALAAAAYAAASNANAVAVGRNAAASGNQSVAIARYANATAASSIAIGVGANATGTGAAVVGSYANALNAKTTAAGYYANAGTNVGGTAFGAYANTLGGTAVGYGATTNGGYTTAVGQNAEGSASRATALGGISTANASYSTALGCNTTAAYSCSTAVGYCAVTTAANALQLGSTGLSVLRSAVSLTVSSDARDKADVEALGEASGFLRNVEAVRFVRNPRAWYMPDGDDMDDEQREEVALYGLTDYDEEAWAAGERKGDRERVGFLAQGVQEALAASYGTADYANLVDDNLVALEDVPEGVESTLAVNYVGFVPFLVRAWQELDARVTALEDAAKEAEE